MTKLQTVQTAARAMNIPVVFSTDRLLEFTSKAELSKLVCAPPEAWPVIAVKELIDNALDACEDAAIAPVIKVEVSTHVNTVAGTISVADNGPGIAPDVVERLTDLHTKTSSREACVAPTRGAQGNALQTILAMPFALDGARGRTVIEAHGVAHAVDFMIDHVHRTPRVSIVRASSIVQNGSSVTLHWPVSASSSLDWAKAQIVQTVHRFAFLNPHVSFRLLWGGEPTVEAEATDPAFRKWRPSEPAPIAWYDRESFSRRIAATIADDLKHGRDRTLREFITSFRGATRSDIGRRILDAVDGARIPLAEFFNDGQNPERVNHLRLTMVALTRPVPVKDLGILGEEHFKSRFAGYGATVGFRYKRALIDADLPYAIETAFAYCPEGRHRQQFLGLNFSPRLNDPFSGLVWWGDDDADGVSLDALLTHLRVTADAPVLFALHLTCPRLMFTDKGKTRLDLPTAVTHSLADVIENVTKQWTKLIRAEERNASAEARREERLARSRKVSIKDAAWEVMEEAYMTASDGDTLPANARQIMYAARPRIQERTGKQLNDAYFTQVLLPDYIAENDADWDLVYDDRGHFREPHTGRIIGLGTLAVRRYLSEIGAPRLVGPQLKPAAIETTGPQGCFSAVMFVEKEGFDQLWESVDLQERYDLGIKSTKGMSVTAARKLADEMCGRYSIPLLVLHDFDKSGFSILGTLREDTRRYTYENEITIIDLGLRLADTHDLQAEDVFDRGDEDARRANLIQNGATPAEVEFLLHRRVELNAMTSRQLVDFVERKLEEHCIGKVIPGADDLADAYCLFACGHEAAQIVERELAKLNGGSPVTVPEDLGARVSAYLAENPIARWDEAVAAVLRATS
jgi:hypothetical protein